MPILTNNYSLVNNFEKIIYNFFSVQSSVIGMNPIELVFDFIIGHAALAPRLGQCGLGVGEAGGGDVRGQM